MKTSGFRDFGVLGDYHLNHTCRAIFGPVCFLTWLALFFFTHSAASQPLAVDSLDSDGDLSPAGGVEPVGLDTTVDTAGEAVDIFDFTLSDGGGSDDQPLVVFEISVNVSGTSTDAERAQISWTLNGPGATNVAGNYNSTLDTITFPGLNISVADGLSETYTISAYYNDNTNLTGGHTILLGIDGAIDLIVGPEGTRMSASSAVDNGTGTTIDAVATQLVFTTEPGGSVSGLPLTTPPVVQAQDAFGNIDGTFTETITLTEASAGTLSNTTEAAVNGAAAFNGLTYTATADQEGFTLTASGGGLGAVSSSSVTSDVVATQLQFTQQPAPTTITPETTTVFSTIPEVAAVDDNGTVDTGYSAGIILAEENGDGSALLSAAGDTDGDGDSVTIAAVNGVSDFSAMEIFYTPLNPSTTETFNLRASSGALTTADSDLLTAFIDNQAPTGISLDSMSVNQSGGVNAAVGTLSTTDPNTGDNHSYSLVAGTGDDDNGSFNISGNELRANDAENLAAGSYSVRIQTEDGDGETFEEAFTITVVDDIAPSGHSVSFDDNLLNSEESASVSFTFADAEVGADYSFSISSSGGGTPVTGTGIVSGAGEQISGIDASGLSNGTLTLSVTLTDSAGNSAAAVTDTATLETTTEFSVASATGTGLIEGSIAGGGEFCTISQALPTSPGDVAGAGPDGVEFEHGLLAIALVNCTPGADVTVTATFPSALSGDTAYYKYGPTPDNPDQPDWYVMPATQSGATFTWTITDGGLGDDDLEENGTILDPGGPASAVAATPGASPVRVPTLPQWALTLVALVLVGIGRRSMAVKRPWKSGQIYLCGRNWHQK